MRVRKSSYPKSGRTPKKTLVQHLLEVIAQVPSIPKVAGEEFDYLRILDLSNKLRDRLLERGILLIPNDVGCWRDSWLQDGRVVTQYGVETEFELTDGHRSKRWKSFGSGQDMDGFALSIAQTMAIKAWLKRVGLIFGDRDDPEKEQSPRFHRESAQLNNYKSRAWKEACAELGIDTQQAEALLTKRMDEVVTFEDIQRLSPKKFDFAISVLKGQRDLTGDLEKSLEIAKGKAQPIVAVMDRRNGDEHVAGD